MRIKTVAIAMAALWATAALGQNVDRVFHFTNTSADQDRQEMVNLIRVNADIQRAALVSASNALVVSGTEGQIAMAQWLFAELDKPAQMQPPAKRSSREFRVEGTDDLVKVFYLANTSTAQGLQELVNALRSLTDMQRIITFNSQGALAMRATPTQIAAAEWLINQLDHAAGQNQDSAAHEYTMTGRPEGVLRVFYPKHAAAPQALQETVNAIRTAVDVQRAIWCSGPRAVAMRGTAAQAARAEQLVKELDRL